ncbi:hypothetical protein DGG96_07390 [Legionella qingyii]|uniref:Uncharacterized protein n=1 Tax=Legionella qingyii TaxID=2184757 RepID=A0A317U7D9_9GAMM|nr:hypothetical protein DGG96_07390 [Legionella qingyii]
MVVVLLLVKDDWFLVGNWIYELNELRDQTDQAERKHHLTKLVEPIFSLTDGIGKVEIYIEIQGSIHRLRVGGENNVHCRIEIVVISVEDETINP